MVQRLRTLIVVGFILVALIGILHATSQIILGGSYATLEAQAVHRDLNRALDALNFDFRQLNSKAGDWATWDDAYEFMQDGNAEFIKTNLTDLALVQLDIQVILFLSPNGDLLLSKTIDAETKSETPLSTGLTQLLSNPQALAVILQNQKTDSHLTGILVLGEKSLLFAARPVVTSEGKGPIHGTLVFGHYLDQSKVDELAATTHLDLTLERLDSVTLPDDFRAALPNLSDAASRYVHVRDENTIHGYTRLPDVLGKPALILRVNEMREVYQQGQDTIRFFTFVTFAIVVGAAAFALVLIDRLVLSRQGQRESEERYRAVIEQAAEGIFLYDAETLCVVETNAAFRRLFGSDAPETRALTFYDVFDAERQTLTDIHARIVRERIAEIGEQRIRRGDGALLDTESSASVINYGGREVVCAVIRDVTERKRAEAERARLFEQEQTRRQELDALYGLSRALADTSDYAAMLNLVAFHAVNRIHATFARILLLEGDELVVSAVYPARDLGHAVDIGKRVHTADSPNCLRILQGDAAVILHHMDASLSPIERELLALDFAQSLCALPLRVEERALGILALGEARRLVRERFTAEKINLARSIAEQAAGALRRAELFAELERTYLQTVLALARTVDAKDTYTADHADRLAEMALAIGREMGLSGRELEDLRYGAILHDIGKIGVADAILLKPARLNEDEWKKMRRHPEIGAQILAPVPRLAGAANIVHHHHERWDGTGYPDKLAGEAIPLGARILTVVDSFSAIMDKRVYKESGTLEQAITELKRNAGTQFDTEVAKIFLRLLAEGKLTAH